METPNLSAPLPRRTTAIFTKKPVPGMVKTRLCPPLVAAQAAELAEAMLLDIGERVMGVRSFHACLCYAPEGARAWFRAAFPGIADLRPQVGAGLGERLAGFFHAELVGTVGSTAVAIGSDAPLVGVEAVCDAHDQLDHGADLVLGPDDGGGYYLIGMREPHPELVLDVEMSTPDNLERTIALARSRGLRVDLLASSYDIDVEADLARLRADLARMDPDDPCYPRRTADVLDRLTEARA